MILGAGLGDRAGTECRGFSRLSASVSAGVDNGVSEAGPRRSSSEAIATAKAQDVAVRSIPGRGAGAAVAPVSRSVRAPRYHGTVAARCPVQWSTLPARSVAPGPKQDSQHSKEPQCDPLCLYPVHRCLPYESISSGTGADKSKRRTPLGFYGPAGYPSSFERASAANATGARQDCEPRGRLDLRPPGRSVAGRRRWKAAASRAALWPLCGPSGRAPFPEVLEATAELATA